MLQTFEYCDDSGDIRSIAVGHSKRTEVEEDGTTVFILDEIGRLVTIFFLLPGEYVQVREDPVREPATI